MTRYLLNALLVLGFVLAASTPAIALDEGGGEPPGPTPEEIQAEIDRRTSDARNCVADQYRAVLRRDPDYPGADGWVNALVDNRLSCDGLRRALMDSGEYREIIAREEEDRRRIEDEEERRRLAEANTDLERRRAETAACVSNQYQDVLGRSPDQGGLDGFVVAVLQGRTSCPSGVRNSLISSQEYRDRLGEQERLRQEEEERQRLAQEVNDMAARIQAATTCVNAQYQAVLNRGADSGAQGFIDAVVAGRLSCPTGVRLALANSDEYRNILAARDEEERRRLEEEERLRQAQESTALQARRAEIGACVTNQYQEVLKRAPDAPGLESYVTAVLQGRTSCPNGVRVSLMQSPEYQNAIAEQERLRQEEEQRQLQALLATQMSERIAAAKACVDASYRAVLNRGADSGAQGFIDAVVAGRLSCPTGVRLALANSDEYRGIVAAREEEERRREEEEERQRLAQNAVARQAFEAENAAFVANLYRTIFGREPDGGPNGAQSWINELNASRLTRAQVQARFQQIRAQEEAARIATQEEVERRRAEEEERRRVAELADQLRRDTIACVTKAYQDVLGRAPDQPGLNSYVNAVLQRSLTCPTGVRTSLMNSQEYRNLVASRNPPSTNPPTDPNPLTISTTQTRTGAVRVDDGARRGGIVRASTTTRTRGTARRPTSTRRTGSARVTAN